MIKTPVPIRRRNVASDAYTFLHSELEKVDERIQYPLSGTEWPQHITAITGGGLLEHITSVDVAMAASGASGDNFIFESTTDIPNVMADLSESKAKCITWAENMTFSTLEREKMIQVGRDPETFLNKGIRLHLDKDMDQSVFLGVDKHGTTGLVNNPNITRSSADPHTPEGTDSDWASKTADEILADINSAIAACWRDNDCSSDALPDHILVPVEQFSLLVTRKVSEDSERSILAYVLENNLTAQQGGRLIISPCKYCSGVGSDDSDRMVVYMNREDRICFNITVPLRRMDTEYYNMRIRIPYIAQFSEVRFLYPSTVRYLDGI